MNQISIFTLKALRKLYERVAKRKFESLNRENDAEKVSNEILSLLSGEYPCMIARIGATELSALINYIGVNSKKHSVAEFVKGNQPEWWWNKNIMHQMELWSGFFPATPDNMQKFGDRMFFDMKEVDLLGGWMEEERYVEGYVRQAIKVQLRLLEPFWVSHPWTKALEGRKVLVIHPFAELIEQQYNEKREKLFSNPEVLPIFSLQTLKAVQSIGGESNGFFDWFEALQYMQDEIDKREYDIALIGCGAYGFPLAAHIKRTGKKAVHLGGVLQLLFGIRGGRWDNPNLYVKSLGVPYGSYTNLVNEFWVRPRQEDKPENANKVEHGCYW